MIPGVAIWEAVILSKIILSGRLLKEPFFECLIIVFWDPSFRGLLGLASLMIKWEWYDTDVYVAVEVSENYAEYLVFIIGTILLPLCRVCVFVGE